MDELTIIVVMEMGIRKFDLKTEGGSVNIVRGYYQYDQNGSLQNRSTVSYPADFWQYTEEDETESETDLWFLPQAEHCLLTDAEKEELKSMALTAAGQVKEAYKDIEITDEWSFGSNSKEFTRQQCREVVSLLGNAGYVSVTEDTNMENYGEIEDFYAAYKEKRDAMVTIFDVNRDGLLGVITFIYRESELQTYYVGIGWQKGGIPKIMNTLVSDIAEIKLTEKGYFIYANEIVIPHSSLREYYRVKPLSDKCRGKFTDGKRENTCGHIRKNNDYIFSGINRTVTGKMRL